MFEKQHPIKLFSILLLFVFTAELGIMFLLGLFEVKTEMNWQEALVDATLLTSLCVPFFWIFLVKPLQHALHLESFKSSQILEMAAEGIVSIDAEGVIQSFNRAAQKMFGYSEAEIIGQNIKVLMQPPHRESHGNYVARYFQAGVAHVAGKRREIEGLRKNGTKFPMELAVSEVKVGNTHLFTGMLRDISEQKRAQDRIQQLEQFDALTQLPNRSLFNDRLGFAIMLAKRSQAEIALLHLDLDGFKKVNDAYGHQAGDMLLVQVAKRMQQTVRESDTLARLGGDEFLIVLNDIHKRADIETVAKKIIEALSHPFDLQGHAAQIGVSIGIARYPDEGLTSGTLLLLADKAMHAAKTAGKNTYRFGFAGDATANFRILGGGV